MNRLRWPLVCALALITLVTPVAYAIDGPAGFYYGVDSQGPIAVGSAPPYQEPVSGGGTLGFYEGEVTTWTDYSGCTTGRAWNETDFLDADGDHAIGRGPGSGMYYFLGGPGVDPNYNGTTTEAYDWGYQQAVYAWYEWQLTSRRAGPGSLPFGILWMDVEPGAPGSGFTNGWNAVGTACGRYIHAYIDPAVDRATVDGFYDYVHKHTPVPAGVYSAPAFWAYTFGAFGYVPHTYEWTYESDSGDVDPPPSGWCQFTDFCAQFFGGQNGASPTALAWQWSVNGGDYNQIDANRW